MHKNLEKLRALTNILPPVANLDDIAQIQQNGVALYQTEKGKPIQA